MIETIRPKLEFLSEELIRKILDEAYEILEKQGVFVENQEALTLLKEAGMKVDDSTQRVHITSKLIEDSLSSTPSIIKLYDRTGEKEFIVGENHVHFDPGSTAITILDHETQEERKPVSEDLVKFLRLTDCMDNIHFQSTGIVSSDVPDLISDSYRLFLGLQYCAKPVVTGTFRVEGFKPMHDMLVAIRGSEQNLREKPLAIFDACPSPPLKWSNLTTQSLIDCARAGIPSELISMGMTGATSPVTIAGTLVQHVAENLCGLVICQLAKKESPVVFGGSPSSFDMRKGTTPMGAIETMMIDSAYTQIGKFLNLPTHAYMGLSDSKINDSQSGFETGIGAIIAALSGVNVISGPGMLNFESCQSLEKLVVDNDICGMAYRLIEGISQRDEPIAKNLFEGFTAETQFLSMPHTRQWYRQEHIFSKVVDRDTYDYWVSLGRKSIADRASEEVERLLKENPHTPMDETIVQELGKIMLADARENGISSLPELKL
ncbi:MAG: trimethylamine methyltransferase family protein [Candidatus Aminicenantes bacterium]|nr:MAG: trimethylamine methyltransferase family protein [Candidatus Aminicenantes bacterium]